MKKVLTNILYFVPAVISLSFYTLIVFIDGFERLHPAVWLFVALLFASAILMMRKKWWGCIGGLITGAVLIYMGTKFTGQIVNEKPIGIIFCIYYIICCFVCIKSTKPTNSHQLDKNRY